MRYESPVVTEIHTVVSCSRSLGVFTITLVDSDSEVSVGGVIDLLNYLLNSVMRLRDG